MNDARSRLERILARIRQARAQLMLHPDAFDATTLLKISETELAIIIDELFPRE